MSAIVSVTSPFLHIFLVLCKIYVFTKINFNLNIYNICIHNLHIYFAEMREVVLKNFNFDLVELSYHPLKWDHQLRKPTLTEPNLLNQTRMWLSWFRTRTKVVHKNVSQGFIKLKFVTSSKSDLLWPSVSFMVILLVMKIDTAKMNALYQLNKF